MSSPKILLWYRRDLRLHDHQPLMAAIRQRATVIPLYCFDPREFGTTSFGFPKTGNFRGQFLIESVADLRRSLREKGSNLLIHQGKPEEIIPKLCEQYSITAVYWHREVTAEETRIEKRLQRILNKQDVTVETFWGTTLHDPDELPFGIRLLTNTAL